MGGVVIFILLAVVLWPKGQPAMMAPALTGKTNAGQLYAEALNLKQNGDLLKAKEIYQKILSDFSDYEKIDVIQKELDDLNIRIIFSNTPAPKTLIHEVQTGDTLGGIAQKYGTTMDLIKIGSHLSGNVIRVGQKLRIWKGNFNIFVDKSQNILILKDGEEVVKTYRVATGQNNSTPVGQFKIINKLVDPVWFNKGIVVPPESPANVLGSRWMGFDIPGYGIHGTIEPETIGKQTTAGCVRMVNQDAEELYTIVPIGTPVVIVD